MNWTQKDLDAYHERLKTRPDSVGLYVEEAKSFLGWGDSPVKVPKDRMNSTEREYAQYLDAQRAVCQISWWAFEGVKLRLADNTYYTPDFAVMRPFAPAGLSGNVNWGGTSLEMHEVKGFWRDDARVKIKVAAEHFPFKFIAVTKIAKRYGGGFKVEEF